MNDQRMWNEVQFGRNVHNLECREGFGIPRIFKSTSHNVEFLTDLFVLMKIACGN